MDDRLVRHRPRCFAHRLSRRRRLGFANLALRGEEAWVGGVGVVPAARRQGIGETLMRALHEEARAAASRSIWLEVIEQNEGAFRLYEKLGYEVVREARGVDASEKAARPASAARFRRAGARAHPRAAQGARAVAARRRDARAPRRPARRSRPTTAPPCSASRGVVQLVQIAGEDARASAAHDPRHGDGRASSTCPSDDPAAEALRELGGEAYGPPARNGPRALGG